MSLKIRHLDETSALGTLDGALPFEIRRDGKTTTARIAGWVHTVQTHAASSAAGMRAAAYAVVARYRDAHRHA
ncbi:hypothetical protein [Salipiger mucosus]|uniref:Uncharacterized protein n=1 Tax=Salipiger mucosus DSM 16094 TaxID=1123237 RepID=S9QEY1_9RHOB|nr:hypothetical protein [Salipiger mucosus]EPX78098.1 hypothetical protein Salmuc_03435 [Salipiger mucosus DSM 16094]